MKLAVDVFNARMRQKDLVTKAYFDAKLSGLNKKITQNKTIHLLVENDLNKLKTFLLVRAILKKMVIKII